MREKIENYRRNSKATFYFLLIMLVYFIFIALNGGTRNILALVKYGALFPPFVWEYGEYYRLITSIFIHIGFTHIFFNSYALYVFGPQIERLMGTKKYFFFFLLSGIGGNIVSLFFNQTTISAGASGSIFGIFGAFFYLIHRHGDIVTPEGRKHILSLLGVNLLITFLIPSISITSHLGGFATGYLLSYFFIK